MDLKEKRKEIDAIDDRIMSLVLERARVAESIGLEKKRAGAPILDGGREVEVEKRYSDFASAHGLDPEIFAELARLLMAQCRAVQKDL